MGYTKYSSTAANNTNAAPDGAPEGIATTDINDVMRDMMAVSMGIYLLCLLALLPVLAMHGLWLSLLVSLIARGFTLGWRYPALEAVSGRP